MSKAERERVLRILDVNQNRALEALRVVEEHARFVLDSPGLSARLKGLRHDLSVALAPFADALVQRDVAGDVGHPAVREDTRERAGAEAVARANASRAKEALRALEEYAKVLDPAAAASLSKARYAFYELEQALLCGPPTLVGRGVYVLLGPAPGRPSVRDQLEACLEAGVRLFQLREKDLSDRALVTSARDLAKRCDEAGALLLLNDRPDLARLSNAHGLHVGRDDLPARDAHRITGPGRVIGASVHDAAELQAALAEGPDYVGVGTLFASPTKPDLAARGLEVLKALAPSCPIPIYGIGGITAENAASVVAAGAAGVAVSSAVLDAKDISAAARAIVEAVASACR